MANTFRIKRRAQGGGAGAPTTLANAELAFNEQTDILYYGEGTGGEGGTATQVLPIGGSGAFVDLSSNQEVGGTKTFTASPIVPTPTTDTQAANKGYVDAVARGLDWKPSVRVATGSNITLSGTQTIDGKAVVAGDRVLVRAQTTASANGIYVVASGAWTRADDFSATGGPSGTASATAGATVFVSEGTTYGNTSWTCTTDDPITVGTTPVTFSQVAGSGSEATAINVTPTVIGSGGNFGPFYQKVGNELQFRSIAVTNGLSMGTAEPDTGTTILGVDSSVVRTSGNQEIAGNKRFTSPVVTVNGVYYQDQSNVLTNYVYIDQTGVYTVGAAAIQTAKSPTANNDVVPLGYLNTQLGGKQDADATLTALAGVTVAANQLIYSTGADAFAVTGLTAAGRALLDDADAAAQRTTLGLAIGTNVQAYDAGLNSIAGLTTAANKMIYTTAADTYAVADLSAFARTILDDADAAAVRGTLGLGSAATSASSAFQPADADLTAIAALTGTSGFLKKTAADTWTLDTASYQASDATLTALAGVTTAANKLVYATGADTFTTTDLTAFGRSLLDDADATTARGTLGLGTAATMASTAFQAADADLTAIAALTGTSGFLKKTAADTWALDTASYQASDATLTALAGVTTAANKLIYATGADTFTTTDLSSFGRSLIDDANATAARSTLGLDTMATQAASNVNITGGAIDGITLDGGTF